MPQLIDAPLELVGAEAAGVVPVQRGLQRRAMYHATVGNNLAAASKFSAGATATGSW